MSATVPSTDQFLCISGFVGKTLALDATNRIPHGESKQSGLQNLWVNQFGSRIAVTRLKDDTLYLASYGQVCSVNSLTGETNWKIIPEETITSNTKASSNLDILLDNYEPSLYYSQAGSLFKISQTNGSLVWKASIDVSDVCMPVTMVETQSSVIVGTYGHIFAYDKQTGKLAWKNELGGYGNAGLCLAVRKDNVLIAGINGYLVAINTTDGKTIEYRNLHGTGWHGIALALDPFNDNLIYLATQNQVRCMSYQNGKFEKIWKAKPDGMIWYVGHSLFLDCDSKSVKSVIVGMATAVVCLDASNGKTIWTHVLKDTGGSLFVTLNDFDDTSLVALCGPQLHGINKNTGKTDWGATLTGLGAGMFTVSTKRQSTNWNSTNLPQYADYVKDAKSRATTQRYTGAGAVLFGGVIGGLIHTAVTRAV